MSRIDIKQAKWEIRKLAELTNWDNNPRSILKEDFERLQEQIVRLGVHNGLLVNQDNIVLGGNMRLRAFQELNKKFNLDEIMCRVVETTDPGQMLEYALSDNDTAGQTDELKLAEVFHLHPIETRLYKIQSNNLRTLENIINPPLFEGSAEPDESDMDESLKTYLSGDIKQIVLYYPDGEYQHIISLIEELGQAYNLKNNTEIITRALKETHAGSFAKKEAN